MATIASNLSFIQNTVGAITTSTFNTVALPFTFSSNSIEYVRIDTGGNLNVNTATILSGGAKLNVNGGVFVNGIITATTFVGNFSGAITGAASQVTTAPQNGNASYYPLFVSSNIGSNQSVYTTSSFVINPSTGYVGIGNSSPAYPLDVNGTINSNSDIIGQGGRLSLYRSAGASYIDWASGQALAFRTETSAGGAGTTEFMRIDANGRVGIGTSGPQAPLHIVAPSGGGVGGSYGIFDSPNNGNTYLTLNYSGTSYGAIGNGGSTVVFSAAATDFGIASVNNLVFGTGGSVGSAIERVRIDTNGRVLIGTTTPYSGEKLAVNGGAYINGILTATNIQIGAGLLLFSSGSQLVSPSTSTTIRTNPATGNLVLNGGGGSSNAVYFGFDQQYSGGTYFSQSSTTLVYISTTSGIIINNGITSYGPGTQLSVNGGGYFNGAVTATNFVLNGYALSTSTFNGGTITSPLIINNVTASTSTNTGALQVTGGVGVGGSVYVGNRVGFVNTSNASVVYQYYNAATNSLDTVFG